MKTILTLLVSFLIGISTTQAQWIDRSGITFGNSLMWNVQVLDDNNIWAINYDTYQVVKTSNGGQSWTTLPISDPTFTGYHVEAMSVLSPTTAWLTASTNVQPIQSRIYKTTNGGLSWQHQTSAYANPGTGGSWAFATHFFDANNGINIGEKLVRHPTVPAYTSYIEILTTADGGTTWQEVPAPNMPPAIAGSGVYYRAYAAIGNNLWFMTMNGRIYKTTNKGITWTELNPGFSTSGSSGASIAFSDANNGIAAFGSSLKRTTDGGATWNTINPAGSWYNSEIAFVPGTNGTFISGTSNQGTFGSSITYDHGNTWTSLETIHKHADIHFINPTTGWSASNGKMLQFNNSLLGISEEESTSNSFLIYPNPCQGLFHISQTTAKPFALEVYDVVGNKIMSQQGNSFGKNTLDLSGQKKGIYLLHILSDEQRIIEKIVLQ